VTVIFKITECCIRVSWSSNEIAQSADFLAVKASLSPQNASIIPDSYYAQNYAGIIASSLAL